MSNQDRAARAEQAWNCIRYTVKNAKNGLREAFDNAMSDLDYVAEQIAALRSDTGSEPDAESGARVAELEASNHD